MPTRLLYLDRPSGGTLTESIKRVYGCHGSRGEKSNCKASMATFLREVLGGVIHRQRIVGKWKKEYPREKDHMWA